MINPYACDPLTLAERHELEMFSDGPITQSMVDHVIAQRGDVDPILMCLDLRDRILTRRQLLGDEAEGDLAIQSWERRIAELEAQRISSIAAE